MNIRKMLGSPKMTLAWPADQCLPKYYTDTVMPKINTNLDFNVATPKPVTVCPDGKTSTFVYECFRLPNKFYDLALNDLKIPSVYLSDNYTRI